MTTTKTIPTARVLHYKPRSTDYRVLHHNVRIKQQDGSWELGCMYVSREVSCAEFYTRPYSMFDMNKWEILK